MIVDARALDVEAVPSEILRRNAELNALSSALEPLLDGHRGGHSIVYGPTGSGKTACARYTLHQLRQSLIEVRTQYINCWQHSSRFAFLMHLVDGVGQSMDIQQHSTPHDELLRRIRHADDRPYVVILDEADQLDARNDLLYKLTLEDHIHFILIANRERDLFNGLEPRVSSRLRGCQTIEFDAYSSEILADILERRADIGLESDAVFRDTLEEIAEISAGDARIAIRTLAEAAKQAERDGRRITSEYIAKANVDAEDSIRQKAISQLTRHQRVIYETMHDGDRDEWAMGEIYDGYGDAIEEPRTRKTVASYLKKMAHYEIVGMSGEKRGRRYWLVR